MRKTEIVDSGCLLLDISPNWPFDPHDTRPWLEFDERWSFTQKLHRRWSCQKWPWLYWDDVSSAMIQIFGGTKKIVDSGYGCCMTFLQIDLRYQTPPRLTFKISPLFSTATSCEASLKRPVSGEEFRTISSASTMLLGQVTKALKNSTPFGVFLHVPKVPSNEPKVCAPRRPGGFKVFLEAGLQLPLPPKKVATGPMPAKHWKECLVLVQKGMAGQDCHGLYFKMVFFVKLMSS